MHDLTSIFEAEDHSRIRLSAPCQFSPHSLSNQLFRLSMWIPSNIKRCPGTDYWLPRIHQS